MTTYLYTRSLSEFRINPDQSIDRMALMSVRWTPFARPGSTWDTIRIGQALVGDDHGHPFRTSLVDDVAVSET